MMNKHQRYFKEMLLISSHSDQRFTGCLKNKYTKLTKHTLKLYGGLNVPLNVYFKFSVKY